MKLIARKSECKNTARKMLVISPKAIVRKTLGGGHNKKNDINNTDIAAGNTPGSNSGFNCDGFQCFLY